MKYLLAYRQLINQCITFIAFALLFFIVGCSSTPHHTEPRPTVSEDNRPTDKKTFKRSTPVKYSIGQQIVSIASSQIGTPYLYGGATPNGFDCSGLVYYTHQQLDITVPRTTKQQASYKPSKQLSDVEVGDILFFKIYGSGVSHAGIYAGNNQFIHAPKSGKYVSYANVNDPYWRQRLIKVSTLH